LSQGEFGAVFPYSCMQNDLEMHPIVLDGRLVALAAAERCYVLTDVLTDPELEFVVAMCLCSREVREGRLAGPFTGELAERWARVYVALGG
jgi:hypothetical protein